MSTLSTLDNSRIAMKLEDLSFKTPIHITEDGFILGWWDDCGGYQFLVNEHPNGMRCNVFVLGGSDYGGGVEEIYHGVSAIKLKDFINSTPTWNYDQASALKKWLRDS